jgi:hypothetical protein
MVNISLKSMDSLPWEEKKTKAIPDNFLQQFGVTSTSNVPYSAKLQPNLLVIVSKPTISSPFKPPNASSNSKYI